MRTMSLAIAVLFILALSNVSTADTKHRFVFDARNENPRPKSVHLAGNFNGWSKDATQMIDDGTGVFSAELPLADGLYQYKFVLDGQKWVNDPSADKTLESDDNYGGKNSGLRIGPDPAKLPPPEPNHINRDAIRHDPSSADDLNVADAHTFRVRLRAQAGDVEHARLVVDESGRQHAQDMLRTGTSSGFDAFAAVAQVEGPSARYWIALEDGSATLNVGTSTLYMTPTFTTPDWAKNALWYQIFPERFRNGDTSNDPGGHDYERLVKWQADWWKTQPGEAPGTENFYKGQGNVWKRRYGGDIQGAKQALPYLRSLGVSAIYFNPIFEAESMHKYDTADYRHIDDNFGVNGDLPIAGETDDPSTWKWSKSDQVMRDFIEEAHRQGFKVIFDGVFNHVGKAHPFFQDVLKNGKNSKYADWFEITDWGSGGEPGSPGGLQYKAWDGPNGHLPVLKKDKNLGLALGPREHIFAITKRWLAPDGDPSKGIDGWRLDVPGDIPHLFWIEWRKLVKQTKPDAYISGEIWDWAQPWLGGDQFDAVMNYRFAVACQDFFVNQAKAIKPSEFNDRLNALVYNYPLQVAMVQQNLFDSHDTDRFASMFVNPDLAYDAANRIQDNGPKYKPDKPTPQQWQRMRQAVAFQMTFLGAPMIYYGDEAGMWSPDDPSNRQPMVWKDLEPYENPAVKFDQEQFDFYQRAIAVRAALPALRTGFFRPIDIEDDNGVYAFARDLKGQHVYVALNRSDAPHTIKLKVDANGSYVNWLDPAMAEVNPPAGDSDRPTVAARTDAKLLDATGNEVMIELKPFSTAVISKIK
jgi:glycosidase